MIVTSWVCSSYRCSIAEPEKLVWDQFPSVHSGKRALIHRGCRLLQFYPQSARNSASVNLEIVKVGCSFIYITNSYICPMIVMRATNLSGEMQLVALIKYFTYSALDICQQKTRTTTCSPQVLIILWLCCSFLLTIFVFRLFRKLTNFPPSSSIFVRVTVVMPSESKKKYPLVFRIRAVQWRCTPPPRRVLSNTQQAL